MHSLKDDKRLFGRGGATIARGEAEALAIDALGFIAGDRVLLDRFLALTGLEAGSLRSAAAKPTFLPAVLDFLLGHEPTLLAFAETTGTDPTKVPQARAALRPRSGRRRPVSRKMATVGPAIDSLEQNHPALLVLDVDEVVLEFIAPFERLLQERGARLHPESFRLTGNVRSISTGTALTGHELDQATTLLYEEQERRQPAVTGVAASLSRLSRRADVVFLTAMTPSYYDRRRALLDREGLLWPMIATERSKGAVVAELTERWQGPVVFVDDLPPNLESVRRSAPSRSTSST